MVGIKRIKNLFLISIIIFSIVVSGYHVVAYNQARASSYIIGDNSQIPGFPNQGGDIYNLAILIRFQDQEPMSEEKIQKIEKTFNADTGWSLKTFYNAYTYRKGSCKTYIGPYDNGKISEYVDDMPKSYYTNQECNGENEKYTNWNQFSRELELLIRTVKYVSEQLPPDINVNNLDKNNDGEIDNITFVKDGPEMPGEELLWPHQYGLNNIITSLEESVYYMWEEEDYDNYETCNNLLEQYKKEVSELTIKNLKVNKYNVLLADDFTVSTTAHEFMHVFGYIDDYDYNTVKDGTKRTMGYDLMGEGQSYYNDIVMTTTMYNKYKYGKIAGEPLVITKNGTYTLDCVKNDNGESGRFWAKIETKSSLEKNEGIYCEYRRQQEGTQDPRDYLDEGIANGLIIYRAVDESIMQGELYVYRRGEDTYNSGTGSVTEYGQGGHDQINIDKENYYYWYGDTNLDNKDVNNTIYFYDHSNTGIKITVLEQNENTITIQVEIAESEQIEDEEPNPSEITMKSETTRVEGSVLTGTITREDLSNPSNYSTFSVEKGGNLPSSSYSRSQRSISSAQLLGDSGLTTQVATGGRSQIVENPVEGQTLFEVHEEDGENLQTKYPDTQSVSLANYKSGESIQIGEYDHYQASYIFTHMKENTSYDSEVQQALWSTDLNKGEAVAPNSLGEEANAYASFRNQVKNSGGYKKSIENQTIGQTVTYNRKTKQYTIGPFKVSYIRGFANVVGRQKIDFGAMIDMKLYDQNGKEISKDTWKIVWDEKDKLDRQEGDEDYAYPYSQEAFYIQMNYEGNEEVTRISKIEYDYKELQTKAEYVELNGKFSTFNWSQEAREYICGGGTEEEPCRHNYTSSHVYAHDYWIRAQKIREEESEKLISVKWADTTWNYYNQTVEFGEKKNIQETNDGNKYQIGLTLELTGYVWEDGQGYEDSGDGIKSAGEANVDGVKVTLYKVENKESKEVAQIFKEDGSKTDAITYTVGGKYHLEGIPVGEYNIEFTYDGQEYVTTKLLETQGSSSTTEEKVTKYKENASITDDYNNNSKAIENEEERRIYNNKFAEIVPGKAIGTDGSVTPLEYQNGKVVTKDSEGHVKDEFAMKISTMENYISYPLKDEFTISQKNKDINETEYERCYGNMYYINLGLIKRAEADFEITGDIVESKVTVNKKEMTYTYGEGKDYYTRDLYKADINYRIDDYKNTQLNGNGDEIRALKTTDDELKVYVTYKITIKDTASEVSGIIHELVNYYDENYSIVTNDVYQEIEDDNGNSYQKLVARRSYYDVAGQTGNINWVESSQYDTGQKSGYKTAYTTDTNNIQLRGNTEYDIYITYEVTKDDNRKVNLGEKKSMVEINRYSTYRNDAPFGGEPLGRIDKDSAPGDANPYDSGSQQDDNKNFAIINVKENEREMRNLNGVVWEDSRDTILLNGQIVGNGKREDGEKEINGVRVQLIEMIKKDNKTYEYIWQEMYTGENAYQYISSEGNLMNQSNLKTGSVKTSKGEYQFNNYVAGNYVVRFIYGDTEKTITNGKNGKSYTGQDYKSTAYQNGNNIREEWYRLSDELINNQLLSDAKDNEQRRLNVINYSKTVTNPVANVLVASDLKNTSLYRELEDNTWMYADTAKINVKVEYDKVEGRGEEYYKYYVKNIDLGLEERPKNNINITKEIENIKITLSNGYVLINTVEGLNKNVMWTPTIGKLQGKVHIYMDEEMMQGTEVEITYRMTIKNEGEVDSFGNEYSVGETYYTGKNSQDQIVTSKIDKLIDYVDNSLVFKKEKNAQWELIENTDLQTVQKMKEMGYLNKEVDTTQQTGKTRSETNQVVVNESLKDIGLKPGESVSTQLILSKVISPNDAADDLSYNNMAEIIELTNDVGRRNLIKIVGNQDVEGMPDETDADNTENIIITPPTGAYRNLTILLVIAGILSIFVGLIIWKKRS